MEALAPIGSEIVRLEEVDSTNSYVLSHIESLSAHGTVVTAKQQTGGRGRAGRSFVSFPGKNLTFSVVIHSCLREDDIGFYSLLAGIAVARVLKPYSDTAPRLKWPNDVLMDRRKICGILIERAHAPQVSAPVLIVGIGINCLGTAKDYPEELQKTVTTLEEELKAQSAEGPSTLEPEQVFQQCLQQLELVFQELQSQGKAPLCEEWLQHSNAIGAAVRFESQGGWQDGTIVGLTPMGHLQIETAGGDLQVHVSGDVLYRDQPYGG